MPGGFEWQTLDRSAELRPIRAVPRHDGVEFAERPERRLGDAHKVNTRSHASRPRAVREPDQRQVR